MPESEYASPFPEGMTAEAAAHELNLLGCKRREEDRFEMAEIFFRRALNILPDNAPLWSNLASALHGKGDHEGALLAVQRAFALLPDNMPTRMNLGYLLGSMGQTSRAISVLESILKDDPENVRVRLDLAFQYLNSGDWERGLAEYEVRLEYQNFEIRQGRFPFPDWEGQDLNGKRLMVEGEQGIGDMILFSRYYEWLLDTYPKVQLYICMRPNLNNLFWHLTDDPRVTFVPGGVPFPECDYGCYLISIPRHAGSTPYSVPPPSWAVRSRIQAQEGIQQFPLPRLPRRARRVGICWTGNPKQRANTKRSIPLEMLLRISENFSVDLYSLQCGPGQADIARLGAEALVHDLSPMITPDLVSAGMAMRELDLVITCCTSVAHLAGTLGVPCWVLLCHDPYWIWLRDRIDSPWYDSVRLFRQPRPGDWASVMAAVDAALEE